MTDGACPHCGRIDWSKLPRTHSVLLYVRRRKSATSAEVAEAFGLSIANASNTMTRLTRMGLLRHDGGEPHPNGGVMRTYTPTGASDAR